MRASPLSPSVKLYLKQGEPISLKYEMGNPTNLGLGEAIFLLAAKLDDDEWDTFEEAPEEGAEELRPKKRKDDAPPPKKGAAKKAKTEKAPPMSPVSSVGAWHEEDAPEADECWQD